MISRSARKPIQTHEVTEISEIVYVYIYITTINDTSMNPLQAVSNFHLVEDHIQ